MLKYLTIFSIGYNFIYKLVDNFIN